ncbi:MAG: LacI family DNA-binding transcriptional regulator [Elusimicrobiota bacterium]
MMVKVNMKKHPTIKDIAKMAGTTHSTVSRVITGNATISEKMKTKVLRLMKKLHYHPNLIARGLVRKKTRAFAMIVPDLNPHVLPIVRGAAETCRIHNYGLMLFSTDYWMDENKYFVEVVKNWQVDGVLIYNVVYRKDVSATIKKMKKEKMPFVFINKYLGAKKVNTVSVDNKDAVFQAVSRLAGQGRSRIGMMNGGLISVDGVERFEGYKAALEKLGIKFDGNIVGNANFSGDEAYAEMKRILETAERPDAVFCANDEMATGVIRALRERNLSVPGDVSVIGYDDWEGARFFKPALTTLRPPLKEIGPLAIDLLMKVIKDPKRRIEEIGLKAELITRDSA